MEQKVHPAVSTPTAGLVIMKVRVEENFITQTAV
jgi:hypothetical protein